MQKLTTKQLAMLREIQRQTQRNGMPPTRSELMVAMGYRSPHSVTSHLQALVQKGVVLLLPNSARGLRITTLGTSLLGQAFPDELDKAEELPMLPVVGRVAAGAPILAEQHIEGQYPVAPELFRPRADYLLRVKGMSMREIGILDGDLMAVHRTPEARNGQVVVARLEDEVTVKRFQQTGHQVELLPENPDFSPIKVDLRSQSLVIEGIFAGLLRVPDYAG